MKQNLLGLPLPLAGWGSLALAFAPYVLRAIGTQFPVAQDLTYGIAKVIEQIITLGAPVDPVLAQASLALAGGAALHKTEGK